MTGNHSGDRRGCREFHRRRPTRREALQAGALSAAGLGLAGLFRGRALAGASGGPAGFGRARACILIFMWGGPSQLDTWDPKPEAPSEIRGPFGTIATRTPGLLISEHFPQLAQQTHRLAMDLPPRRVVALDGRIVVTAGNNTMVYPAPEADH